MFTAYHLSEENYHLHVGVYKNWENDKNITRSGEREISLIIDTCTV